MDVRTLLGKRAMYANLPDSVGSALVMMMMTSSSYEM